MTFAVRMILFILISTGLVVFSSIYFKTPGLLLMIGAIVGLAAMFLNVHWLKNSDDRTTEQISQWALENGWQLLEFNREFSTGPFGGIHGRGDIYFKFAIRDQNGNKRSGWAYFDFSLTGGGRYEIKWTEPVKAVTHT